MKKLLEKSQIINEKLNEVAESTVNRALEEGLEMINEKADNMMIKGEYLQQERKAYKKSYITKAKLKDGMFIGSIQTKDAHAKFAENGTGIVGSRKPNTAIKGWKYDINNHGEEGWVYYADGSFHHTKGLPAFKIYYSTRERLKRRIRKMFKEEMSR